jgi:hypothetical protein
VEMAVLKEQIAAQKAQILYKQCLKLDISIFDGARIGFIGGPVILFKLNSTINIDELFNNQHFEFSCKNLRQGKTHIHINSCKICCLRY